MAGSFGYELDLNRLSEEDKRQISIYNQEFKELWPLIHSGDYYRLSNPFCMKQDQETAAWMHVSEDQREALVFAVLAWILRKLDLPAVPILLGMVLGGMTETNFRRALLISNGNPSIFFSSIFCWATFIPEIRSV